MVASAFTVAAVQLLVPGAAACCTPMQPPSADFDQLKQDLVAAVENHDIAGALELVSKLENSTVTKEILESTRLGGTVNEIRKKTADSAPALAKRCRVLIKNWQKLIDYVRPSSSCGSSSTGTTPSLISPAGRARGITPRTPRTPASKLTTPGGTLKTNTNISPGYAPKKISPLASATAIHKSQSVGADLSRQAVEKSISPPTKVNGEPMTNGVAQEPLRLTIKRSATATSDALNGTVLKRSKTSATLEESRDTKTASPSPNQPLSVTAARKNVQSTTELIAQLSENLPEHMAIDLSEHERRVKLEQIPLTVPPMTILRSSLPDATQVRQKRKYVKKHPRFFKNGQLPPVDEQLSPIDETPTDSTESLLLPEEERLGLEPMDTAEVVEEPSATINEVEQPDLDEPSSSVAVPEKTSKKEAKRSRGFNWMAKVPTVEELMNRLSEQAEPNADLRKSYVQRIHDRDVLFMPYVDIGVPDFLENKYPEEVEKTFILERKLP